MRENKELPASGVISESTKEQQARDFADSIKSITDIQVPRYVVNPGLYIGFIKGWEAAVAVAEEFNIMKAERDRLLRRIEDNNATFEVSKVYAKTEVD